ncbi:2OG-Fe(II) oxygenase [Hymenobacter jeollabukensis]|uniref:Oxidoreductase, 2OG-Fe(II) oxygenase n=1 Tax=Hymenobacter jeollabukensis TaxID=2025313 RepID=A0A5R8WMY5_9BACT|nr:2OG-Fe(II) oxygenase [Hymenobacter jeollabukensis]TLM91075.1 oxidoreductase, 2OG-Fe(II) oxygenase [Hymenobacter jeollabukensis]
MLRTQLAESIFTVDDFLTRQECLEYLVLSEQLGYEAAKINTAKGARLLPAVRNNSRAFHRSEELAQTLWEQARPFIPAEFGRSRALGLNELFRFYRYQVGQQFRGHYDESYVRSPTEASLLTFMVYLNDNFRGGDTAFQELSVQPRQGRLLVFEHGLYHLGRSVTQGVKYVLRTDVMFRLPME